MNSFCRFLVSVCILSWVGFASGDVCESSTQFVDRCTSVHKGVTVGGRCFFLAKAKGKWTDGFTKCQSEGDNATFAQIYTEAEMSAVEKNVFKGTTWIALRNSPKLTSNPVVKTGTTRYYNTESTYDANIDPAVNTFLRSHASEDTLPGAGECLGLFTFLSAQMKIGDYDCTWSEDILCEATNSKQDFALTANSCFTGTPVLSLPATSPTDCATVCANEIWCRLFNFHSDKQKCHYYALHATDASAKVAIGTLDCYMYVGDQTVS